MFERFTERARQVVVLAQEECLQLGHEHIGTEHLLLGLLREQEGLAARVLESFDIALEPVRERVIRIDGPGSHGESEGARQIPFTPEAKRALERALREALGLGHDYIGTEHLLLGLVRDSDSVAAGILLDFDVDAERVRSEIVRMLSGPEGVALARSSHRAVRRELDVDRSWLDFTHAQASELIVQLAPIASRISFEVRPHGDGEPTFRASCQLRGNDSDLRDLVALEAVGIRAVLDADRTVRLGHLRRPHGPDAPSPAGA